MLECKEKIHEKDPSTDENDRPFRRRQENDCDNSQRQKEFKPDIHQK